MRYILAFVLLVSGLTQMFAQSAYFTMSDSVGCDSLLVNFNNRSVTAGLNMSYSWNFRNGQTSQLESPSGIKFNKPGLYLVTLTMTQVDNVANKFEYTDTVYIRPHPNANFFIADTFALGALTYIFRSGKKPDDSITYIYKWTLNPHPDGTYDYTVSHINKTERRDTLIYQFAKEGLYGMKLKVTDYFGCVDSLSQKFIVSEKLVIPKAFTPNNDNLNDYFLVQTNGRTKYSLKIFAMTGQLVFKSESYSIIWDGNLMNGSKAEQGTYLYIIEAISGAAAQKESGFVMLLRNL